MNQKHSDVSIIHPVSSDTAPRAGYLLFEYAALFYGLPLLAILAPGGRWKLLLLWATTVPCLIYLLNSPDFDRRRFWKFSIGNAEIWRILITYITAAIGLILFIQIFIPHWFLYLPRYRPGLWMLIIFAYPVVSAYPQVIIYRGFLFHRYRKLFPDSLTMILAATLAFAFLHIIFRNDIAFRMTLVAGLLFSITYHRTQSLLISWIEHSFYGLTIFTLGLGGFFFQGTMRMLTSQFKNIPGN